MVEVNSAEEVSMEDRSNEVGTKNQVCTKCNSIDEVVKAFESREVADWKKKYGDEKKKVKWMTLLLIISWFIFVCYVKM